MKWFSMVSKKTKVSWGSWRHVCLNKIFSCVFFIWRTRKVNKAMNEKWFSMSMETLSKRISFWTIGQKSATEDWNWTKKRTLTFRNEAISLDSFKFSSIFSGEYKRHLYTLADYHKPVGYKKKEPSKNDLRDVKTRRQDCRSRSSSICDSPLEISYKNKANLLGHCVKTLRWNIAHTIKICHQTPSKRKTKKRLVCSFMNIAFHGTT